jgi:hypothetical protein
MGGHIDEILHNDSFLPLEEGVAPVEDTGLVAPFSFAGGEV